MYKREFVENDYKCISISCPKSLVPLRNHWRVNTNRDILKKAQELAKIMIAKIHFQCFFQIVIIERIMLNWYMQPFHYIFWQTLFISCHSRMHSLTCNMACFCFVIYQDNAYMHEHIQILAHFMDRWTHCLFQEATLYSMHPCSFRGRNMSYMCIHTKMYKHPHSTVNTLTDIWPSMSLNLVIAERQKVLVIQYATREWQCRHHNIPSNSWHLWFIMFDLLQYFIFFKGHECHCVLL